MDTHSRVRLVAESEKEKAEMTEYLLRLKREYEVRKIKSDACSILSKQSQRIALGMGAILAEMNASLWQRRADELREKIWRLRR